MLIFKNEEQKNKNNHNLKKRYYFAIFSKQWDRERDKQTDYYQGLYREKIQKVHLN
jgi:hypothetical protein